jgi:hypothetical protein
LIQRMMVEPVLMEKRRRLMTEWATFCARPVATGAVVSPLVGA